MAEQFYFRIDETLTDTNNQKLMVMKKYFEFPKLQDSLSNGF